MPPRRPSTRRYPPHRGPSERLPGATLSSPRTAAIRDTRWNLSLATATRTSSDLVVFRADLVSAAARDCTRREPPTRLAGAAKDTVLRVRACILLFHVNTNDSGRLRGRRGGNEVAKRPRARVSSPQVGRVCRERREPAPPGTRPPGAAAVTRRCPWAHQGSFPADAALGEPALPSPSFERTSGHLAPLRAPIHHRCVEKASRDRFNACFSRLRTIISLFDP